MMQKLANTVKAGHIPMLRTVLLAMLAAGADQSWTRIGVCGNLVRRLKAQFMVAEIDRRLAAPAALTA